MADWNYQAKTIAQATDGQFYVVVEASPELAPTEVQQFGIFVDPLSLGIGELNPNSFAQDVVRRILRGEVIAQVKADKVVAKSSKVYLAKLDPMPIFAAAAPK